MPKIPMIQNAQIRVMSENLPEARAQHFYNPGEATGEFARGLRQLTGAIAQWSADLAAESDKEKFAELELMQSKIDHELDMQCANSPERYAQFGEDARAIEETYAERRKELLEGLTPNGRARAKIMLAERTENRQFNLAKASRRAAVEYGFKQSESQVNSYIDLGDYDAAHRLIDAYASSENGTPLYSEEQAKTMHTYIDRKQEYNAIAGAAANSGSIRIGDANIPVGEALIARNENGTFKHFPLISDKERSELVRAAKTYADGRDVKVTDDILAARAEGRVLYDNQELKAMHAQGLISGKQYKQYVSWNNAHESAVQKGKDAAWTSARDQWILDNLYSDAGTEKMLSPGQAEALCVEARELCGGRASECAKLFDLIRKRVAGVQNGNDVLKTARGAQIKEYLEDFDDLAFGFGVGDKPDENTPRNQKTNTIDTTPGFIKEQRAEAYAWAMRTLEEYPDLSAREIINLLDERMKKVRNGVIGRLFDDYEREFIQYGDQQ